MTRRRLICRSTRRVASNATPGSAAIAFWLLLVLAVGIGGGCAVQGFSALANALLPQGLIAAQAAGDELGGVVAMSLRGPVRAAPFAPEVLTPVEAHDFPAWLTAHAAYGGPVQLRGSETGSDMATIVATAPRATPAIALVIDDLGSDIAATRRAIRLAAPVTLTFLPYPDPTPMLAREAERAGHQVLVHVPMEPEGHDDPGPNALLTGLSAGEIGRRLVWALGRVPGFSGINNHMGSRFTANRSALVPVVEILADRHVFFLDSRTTSDSAVIPLAHAFGVASAGRDVFLDDEQTVGAVDAQLASTEHIARLQGVAIAIGHPHATTLAALEVWLAHLRGFELVPVGTAIRLKTEREALTSARN